jgi:hypothetical protein
MFSIHYIPLLMELEQSCSLTGYKHLAPDGAYGSLRLTTN